MIFNMEEAEWDAVIRVHLKGHFTTMRHAAAYWRNRAKEGQEVYGRIINTTSEAALVRFARTAELRSGEGRDHRRSRRRWPTGWSSTA